MTDDIGQISEGPCRNPFSGVVFLYAVTNLRPYGVEMSFVLYVIHK